MKSPTLFLFFSFFCEGRENIEVYFYKSFESLFTVSNVPPSLEPLSLLCCAVNHVFFEKMYASSHETAVVEPFSHLLVGLFVSCDGIIILLLTWL